MSKTPLAFFLFALLMAACGGTGALSPTTDGGASLDGIGPDGTAAQTTAFEAMCWDSTLRTSTVPDKTCTTADDCKKVTAIRCSFSEVFAVTKTDDCQPPPAPPCIPLTDPSPPYSWLAETGDSTENVDAIDVRCLGGKCQTYVRP